ncbi:MAG: hypothetical protein N4A74_19475 [Carboxylicivirga sp.]|nr:hypothetical protein [Carboxylicivirga sp.]
MIDEKAFNDLINNITQKAGELTELVREADRQRIYVKIDVDGYKALPHSRVIFDCKVGWDPTRSDSFQPGKNEMAPSANSINVSAKAAAPPRNSPKKYFQMKQILRRLIKKHLYRIIVEVVIEEKAKRDKYNKNNPHLKIHGFPT